ncbi:putative zinc-binding protein [Desulfosporosinus fructosivorans]
MRENDNSDLCFVTCPGGSNVSLLAYKAATKLEKERYGKFVRLSGEHAKEKDLMRLADAAKYVKQWVLIEGCSKGCGKKVLESAGIEADKHFLVTSLGIERENKIDHTQDELEQVLTAVKCMIK